MKRKPLGASVADVYRLYGAAMALGQLLEQQFLRALLFHVWAHGELQSLETFMKKHRKTTFGGIVGELRKRKAISEMDFSELIDERNFLAHDFFRLHPTYGSSVSGRTRLLRRLRQSIELFAVATQVANHAFLAVAKRLGWSIGSEPRHMRKLAPWLRRGAVLRKSLVAAGFSPQQIRTLRRYVESRAASRPGR